MAANARQSAPLNQRATELKQKAGVASEFMAAGAQAPQITAAINIPNLSSSSTRATLIFNPMMKILDGLKDDTTLKDALKKLQSALDKYDSATLGDALAKPFGYKISANELAMNKSERNAFVAKLANRLNKPNNKNAPVSRGVVLVMVLKQLADFLTKKKAALRNKIGGAVSRAKDNLKTKNAHSAGINQAIMELSGALAIATAPAPAPAAPAPAAPAPAAPAPAAPAVAP